MCDYKHLVLNRPNQTVKKPIKVKHFMIIIINGNLQWHLHKVAIYSQKSGSNKNLEMFVFEERGKLKCPKKNLSEQRREPITNSTHILRRVRESIPSHIGGR